MGLGKTFNSGLREVLKCDIIAAALKDMDFDWSSFCGMQIKIGDQVVGEEIRDPNTIGELSKRSNGHFLYKNFVISRPYEQS